MTRIIIAVFFAIVGLFGPGCTERPEFPLRVGLLIWPGYEAPYLAEHLGYYDDADIQLVEYHAPAEAMRAYEIEALDALAITLDYTLQLVSHDPGQRVVMAIDESRGGDALLASPDVGSLGELRGRRIGIERSALGAYMLKRALDHAGLDRDEVVVNSVDIPESVAGYRDGRFDAVVTYEPYRSRILELGARQLFSSRDIPGEILDVLMTRQSVIDERGASLRRLVDGWLRAAERLDTAPVSEIELLAARENVATEQFLKSFEGIRLLDRTANLRLLNGDPPGLWPALQRHTEIMLSEGMIERRPDLRQLVDGRFIGPPTP